MGNKASAAGSPVSAARASAQHVRPSSTSSGGSSSRARKQTPAQQRSRRKIMEEPRASSGKSAAHARAPERPLPAAAPQWTREDKAREDKTSQQDGPASSSASNSASKPSAMEMLMRSRAEAGAPLPTGPGGAAPVNPFAAALRQQQQQQPAALRPTFNAGDFAKAALRTTDSRATADSTVGADDPEMDEVRQQQMEDARRCSKEASEIFPWLRVSGDWVARNRDVLREAGVTHVLNMAHTVCANYHEASGDFEYLALDVIDSANESIICFLLEAIEFIEKARASNGCCFVHCHMGVSRSCAVAIAYAMWHGDGAFARANAKVKAARPVCSPNAGFVGQLMEFQRQLTQTPRRPELYRVARHSAKDPSLVVKLCYDRADSARPVTARPSELDARGVFLVHDHPARALFVWVGPRCADEAASLAAADTHAGRLLRLMPSFRGCELLHAQERPALRRAFWTALGASASDAQEMDDADVDQDLLKYDDEYAAQAQRLREREQQHLSRESHKSAAAPPEELARAAEHFRVHLFAWVDDDLTDRWDRLKQYDSEDLSSDAMFVLLVHDKEEARARGQQQAADAAASSSKHFHRAYVWLGSSLEGRLNEEAAEAKARAFVRVRQAHTGSEDVEVFVERDDDESEAFWNAFEAGY